MFPSKIAINLGSVCNFKCLHCSNGFERRQKLTSLEKQRLIDAISRYKIKKVHFIGGEPTLYINDINEIVERIDSKEKLSVIITTNGSFARNKKEAILTLLKIPRLHKVQLSYDKFHAQFLPISSVKNLYLACKNLGLEFGVLFAMQNPLDMVLIHKLNKIAKFPILIQKVLPQGNAIKSNVAYNVYTHFEKKVLNTKCPERNNLVYLCGKGFTVCCSSLVFNSKSKIVYQTPEDLFKSYFYKLIKNHNFRELTEKFKVNKEELKPEYSSVCNLCGHVFKKTGEKILGRENGS